MPKCLPVKEQINFFYAYNIGLSDKGTAYSKVMNGRCQIIDIEKNVENQAYGVETKTTKILLVEKNKSTKYINQLTKIWINKKPSNQNEIEEYKIVTDGFETDGIIKYYISSATENNTPIWYEYDKHIYQMNIMFDKDKFIGQIKNNVYLPLDKRSKIWYIEPDDITDTKGLIQLVSKEEHREYTLLKFKSIGE